MKCQALLILYNCGRIFFILSFFIGYILSFGLVRLRTIWLSARVGAHIERRCSCSCWEDMTITDVIIKTWNRKWDWGCDEVMPGSNGLRILGDFWKKAVSWDLHLDKASWFSSLDEARPVGSTWCAVHCWVRWNSQHSRNSVSLSSCWKPKSQEGNKSFVPELPKVVSVSSVFQISIHMNVSGIHMFYVSRYFTYLDMLNWYFSVRIWVVVLFQSLMNDWVFCQDSIGLIIIMNSCWILKWLEFHHSSQ